MIFKKKWFRAFIALVNVYNHPIKSVIAITIRQLWPISERCEAEVKSSMGIQGTRKESTTSGSHWDCNLNGGSYSNRLSHIYTKIYHVYIARNNKCVCKWTTIALENVGGDSS